MLQASEHAVLIKPPRSLRGLRKEHRAYSNRLVRGEPNKTEVSIVACVLAILYGIGSYCREYEKRYADGRISDTGHRKLLKAFKEFRQFLFDLRTYVHYWGGQDKDLERVVGDLENLLKQRTTIQAYLEEYTDFERQTDPSLRIKYREIRMEIADLLRQFTTASADLACATQDIAKKAHKWEFVIESN